jgi:hypothetical protein
MLVCGIGAATESRLDICDDIGHRHLCPGITTLKALFSKHVGLLRSRDLSYFFGGPGAFPSILMLLRGLMGMSGRALSHSVSVSRPICAAKNPYASGLSFLNSLV